MTAFAARPFLKWAGGKAKLLPQLLPLLPETMSGYCEPFLGGGAMFFELMRQQRVPTTRCRLSDLNLGLMITYEAVAKQSEKLVRRLDKMQCFMTAEDYEAVRSWYNKIPRLAKEDPTAVAAAFIYLNKTGFNGLYRVNKNGQFNVPWGQRPNAMLYELKNLRRCTKLLKGTLLDCCTFSQVNIPWKQSFIYLDPPYDPATETANFTRYTPLGFMWEDQRRLLEMCKLWDRAGHKWMISQADTPRVRELFQGFHFTSLQAPRAIAAKTSSRTPAPEIVIRNYE